MEVQAYNLRVLKLLGMLNDGHHVAHGDAKLVFCQAGGYVGVGMGSDIGVQSEGHACYLSFGSCQLVDDLQFGNALDVETEDVVVESEVDFPIALANAGIDDFRTGESCLDACLNLAAADAIGT